MHLVVHDVAVSCAALVPPCCASLRITLCRGCGLSPRGHAPARCPGGQQSARCRRGLAIGRRGRQRCTASADRMPSTRSAAHTSARLLAWRWAGRPPLVGWRGRATGVARARGQGRWGPIGRYAHQVRAHLGGGPGAGTPASSVCAEGPFPRGRPRPAFRDGRKRRSYRGGDRRCQCSPSSARGGFRGLNMG